MPVRSWKCPTLWKYTAGEVRRRPGRTLLTVLGIVIGVATLVSVWVATNATRRAYREMFEAVTGRAALEVVAEGLGGFDEAVAHDLAATSGVRAAVPVVQTPAAVVGRAGVVPALVLGIGAEDVRVRSYTLRQGRMLGQGPGVLLEAGFAEANGFQLGEPVPLWTPTGLTRLPLDGILEPRGPATFNGGAIVFLPLELAQQRFNLKRRVNGIHLVLDDNADPRQVETAVRARLPAGLTVQAPGMRGELSQAAMLATEQGLGSMSAVSLVAGAFVILNAFLMNLGERRRQLAILRALGATRSQITRLLLREALVLSLTGTLLGIPLGFGLAAALLRMTGMVMGVAPPDLPWSVEPFLYALLLGPGMAVAATFLPARRAGRRSPLSDLVPGRASREETVRRWPSYFGLACLLGLAVLVLGRGLWLFPPALTPPIMAGWAALYLLGCALIMPLVLGPLLRLVSVLLRPWLRGEGSLALRQLDRHRSRTALTAGVLVLALAFVLGYGNTLLVLIQDIHNWIDSVAYGDYYVRSTIPDVTTMVTGAILPESLADDLAAVEGVERVDRYRWVPARTAGQQVMVLAITFPPDRPAPLDIVKGDPPSVLRGLRQGQAVLGTVLAHRLGLGVNDEVCLETPHGPQMLRVAGTTNEYTTGGMALFLDWDTARRLFDLEGAHSYIVTARPGANLAVGSRLRMLCKERGLICQSTADLRAWLDRRLDASSASCFALIGLVFVVAALGVVNTLTMNVLEQTRELGVLRAIGLLRGELRRLVLAQALALGIVSLIPGLLLGLGLAYLASQAAEPLQGHRLPFRLNGWFMSGCVAAALLLTIAAAYFPARRAARLRIVEALRYE